METVGIVQARTDSERLPGKIFRTIGDHTILEILWKRIRNVEIPWWLATTDRSVDDRLSEQASLLGFKVFRGDELDVLSRYEQIAETTDARFFLRINGDNPTCGEEAINALIEEAAQLRQSKFMIADTGLTRHHPSGHVPQIIDRGALLSIRELIGSEVSYHKTHVTSVLLDQHTKQTKVRLGPKAPHLRWTVDSHLDLAAVSGLFDGLKVDFENARYKDFLDASAANNHLANLNKNESQKPIEEG